MMSPTLHTLPADPNTRMNDPARLAARAVIANMRYIYLIIDFSGALKRRVYISRPVRTAGPLYRVSRDGGLLGGPRHAPAPS